MSDTLENIVARFDLQGIANLKASLNEAMAGLNHIAECGCEDPGPEVKDGMRCATRTPGAGEYCNPCVAKQVLVNIETIKQQGK